jgi:CheY-like chemotaxis protein/anti-sigma regulatory factor (Ser/Thr protein kinase)
VRDYSNAPPVEGNPNRLEQVFLNLLLNAAQAMPNGDPSHDEIRIRVRHGNGRVWVEVEDTGEGIPDAIISRIFEPFFSTKPVGVGTGLGLPICRSIIASHNGSISVESEPGKGATFRVELPASKQPRETGSNRPSGAPSPDAPRGRILIVDDEVAVGSTLRLVLQGEHDVHVATNAAEALQMMSQGAYDAIVCDVAMPGMTGIDLYDAVRVAYPGTESSMVFMTGGTLVSQSQEFLAKLENPLLEKPFDTDLLRRTLRRLVRRRRRKPPRYPRHHIALAAMPTASPPSRPPFPTKPTALPHQADRASPPSRPRFPTKPTALRTRLAALADAGLAGLAGFPGRPGFAGLPWPRRLRWTSLASLASLASRRGGLYSKYVGYMNT